MKAVEIITDGACSGNPGWGGWGVVLRCGDLEKELHGGEEYTTNNRMELQAVIEGLSALKETCSVVVTTDSQYVKKGITEWIHAWQRKSWMTASRQPVKNRDLWEQLLGLKNKHSVEWRWVKGHAGHADNERCDALARKWIEDNRSSAGV